MSDQVTNQQLYEAIGDSRKEQSAKLDDFKAEVRGKFDSLDNKLESKFAAKWVEKLALGMVAAILLGFFGGLMAIVWPDNSTSAKQSNKGEQTNLPFMAEE